MAEWQNSNFWITEKCPNPWHYDKKSSNQLQQTSSALVQSCTPPLQLRASFKAFIFTI